MDDALVAYRAYVRAAHAWLVSFPRFYPDATIIQMPNPFFADIPIYARRGRARLFWQIGTIDVSEWVRDLPLGCDAVTRVVDRLLTRTA